MVKIRLQNPYITEEHYINAELDEVSSGLFHGQIENEGFIGPFVTEDGVVLTVSPANWASVEIMEVK